MKTVRVTRVVLLMLLWSVACAVQGPWIKADPDAKIYTLLDIPLSELQQHPSQHIGEIFVDRFKFYRIYRNKKDRIPSLSKQTILGKTHFTARPIKQYIHVVQIQITPEQDAWIRAKGIHRQDVIKAKVRFVGLGEGDVMAFELMEILE